MTEYFIKWIAMCLIVSIIYIAVRIPVLKKKSVERRRYYSFTSE